MDHNNKKWKKRLLGLLGCLAGLVIIIVLGAAIVMVRAFADGSRGKESNISK